MSFLKETLRMVSFQARPNKKSVLDNNVDKKTLTVTNNKTNVTIIDDIKDPCSSGAQQSVGQTLPI